MKKMSLLSALLVCLLQIVTTASAHADTIKTFVLDNGVAYSPLRGTGFAYGSFTLNVDTGDVLAIDFDYVGRMLGTDAYMFVDYFAGLTQLRTVYGSNGTFRTSVSVNLPVTTLVGYAGGFVCSVAHDCLVNSSIDYFAGSSQFQTGSLGLAPEPPSLSYVLLSVACLAALPLVRKRLLA